MGTSPSTIRFTKMTGSGNDFIIIDNRNQTLNADHCAPLVRAACRRKLSVGADGLILIEDDPQVDFRWRFFNADASEAEMCGNGARCAARFAYLHGIVDRPVMAFRTLAGIIEAEVMGSRVKIRMTAPENLQLDFGLPSEKAPMTLNFVNTGVPHTVLLLASEEELEACDVFNLGRFIRHHERFKPAGTNVNFAYVENAHQMVIRTYERGVEDETLACGTGSIAAALVAAAKGLAVSPVALKTRSGEMLTIHFNQSSDPTHGAGSFRDVFLEGEAKVVYEADLWNETLG